MNICTVSSYSPIWICQHPQYHCRHLLVVIRCDLVESVLLERRTQIGGEGGKESCIECNYYYSINLECMLSAPVQELIVISYSLKIKLSSELGLVVWWSDFI